jgi:signal transduction histidine kinase
MSLRNELRSRIQYKIIVPFMALTLLVALAGSSVALLFVTGSAQERLNNQIAQTARDSSDLVVALERANLAFLREVAYAPANPYTGAPAVAPALANRDAAGLTQAVTPYLQAGAERGVRVDRLIVFDRAGQSLVDWERSGPGAAAATTHPSASFAELWFVADILAGKDDPRGDKYAGLVQLGDQPYFYTVVPVVNERQQVVGGAVGAINLQTLLRELSDRSQAAFISLHDASDGHAVATTLVTQDNLDALQPGPAMLESVRALQSSRQDQGVFDTVQVNRRSYQLAYAPLRIRGAIVGIFSVALASDYVITPWADMRSPLLVLTCVLVVAIIGLGIYVARGITRPLRDLVATAEAVIGGDLERRSIVATSDEIGTLSTSFNAMTGHLLELYQAVRIEASHRAAIIESIGDGIAVVSLTGEIVLVNSAMRALLGLDAEDALPGRLIDLPLRPLDTAAMNFGDQTTPDLFQLHDRVVRLNTSTVRADDGQPLGYVQVFQDMTSEVAIDRAKTDFIATISHELRTPLTVIGGNTDLLLSGLIEPVSDNQRPLLEAIRNYTRMTTTLINNIITIASLDAGTVSFDLEPVELADVFREVLPTIQKAARNKGITIAVNLPESLPAVAADCTQLPIVLRQLLDNAYRYSERGTITVTAHAVAQQLQVDISDTGSGIEPELQSHLFTRFTRGSQGINSAERGIGLGLAIAREIIERQGGRLWLDRTSAAGSTFSFVLPQACAETTTTIDTAVEPAVAYA